MAVDGPRIDHIAAALIAVALNAACAWLLFRGSQPASVPAAEAPLQVVWITRPDTPRAGPAVDPRPTAPFRRRTPIQAGTAKRVRPVQAPAPPPTPAPVPAAADDAPRPAIDWSLRPAARTAAETEAAPTFVPDPLGNRRPLLGSQPDRMDLRFIDRSVGGRLREMSRLSVCGELRRAMRTSAASMAAIEASLRRHRCID